MATTHISDSDILRLFQKGRTTMGPIPIGTPQEESDLVKDVHKRASTKPKRTKNLTKKKVKTVESSLIYLLENSRFL